MKKKTHFLGIGGTGMSALAYVLLERGDDVSGYDKKTSTTLCELEKKGAILSATYDQDTQVVYSSAIKEDHPSLCRAKKIGCVLYHRSQFLACLMKKKQKFLVSGTHGKTSTSALLTWVLISSGLDPSYAIGGVLNNTFQNGGYGRGNAFVAEADESDGSFLNYQSDYTILTNLEAEHLDFWKTEGKLIEGFHIFSKQTKHLLWCMDDPILASLKLSGQAYGKSKKADWHLFDVEQKEMELLFAIAYKNRVFKQIKLPLIGGYQALNACAVWALAYHLGIPEEKIRKAFSTFQGVRRRLEKKGENGGVVVYDDYAHHPTEVKIMLTALKKAIGKRRLVAIFQPHRFTRTRDCLRGFINAFHAVDQLYITDIYSAGEKPIPGVTGKALAKCIPGSLFFRRLPRFKSGDVVITIGAGDINALGPIILESFR